MLHEIVQGDVLVMHRSSHLECGLSKTVGAGHLDGGESQIPEMNQSVTTTAMDEKLANWPSPMPTRQWALHFGHFYIV